MDEMSAIEMTKQTLMVQDKTSEVTSRAKKALEETIQVLNSNFIRLVLQHQMRSKNKVKNLKKLTKIWIKLKAISKEQISKCEFSSESLQATRFFC